MHWVPHPSQITPANKFAGDPDTRPRKRARHQWLRQKL